MSFSGAKGSFLVHTTTCESVTHSSRMILFAAGRLVLASVCKTSVGGCVGKDNHTRRKIVMLCLKCTVLTQKHHCWSSETRHNLCNFSFALALLHGALWCVSRQETFLNTLSLREDTHTHTHTHTYTHTHTHTHTHTQCAHKAQLEDTLS